MTSRWARGARRVPRNQKAASLLLVVGWFTRGQLVQGATAPCVTPARRQEMCRLTALPSSSEDLSPHRSPLHPPTKAQPSQMEAAGASQENGGPAGHVGRSRGSRKAGVKRPSTLPSTPTVPSPGLGGLAGADTGPGDTREGLGCLRAAPHRERTPATGSSVNAHRALGSAGRWAWTRSCLKELSLARLR